VPPIAGRASRHCRSNAPLFFLFPRLAFLILSPGERCDPPRYSGLRYQPPSPPQIHSPHFGSPRLMLDLPRPPFLVMLFKNFVFSFSPLRRLNGESPPRIVSSPGISVVSSPLSSSIPSPPTDPLTGIPTTSFRQFPKTKPDPLTLATVGSSPASSFLPLITFSSLVA